MKRLIFIVILVFLFSCDNKRKKENTYQVISIIHNELAKPIELFFPPPPPNSLDYVFTSKDSLRIDSLHKKIKDERAKRKFIVAIDPFFKPNIERSNKYFLKDCSNYNDLIDKLFSIKDSLKVDIDNIIAKRDDSIIYFKKELVEKDIRDFFKFDMHISFSKTAFNINYTKAVVVATISRSTTDSGSILYFLKKEDNMWRIECSKELSIS